jgi:hypothetical protein
VTTWSLSLADAREILDDANGSIGTHSVVIYGNTASGDFLLADPWQGLTQVS